MSDNFDIIITDLATKAFNYHCKANEYREKGELEGALINYLLSTNNLYMIKKAIPGDNRDLSEAIQNSNCSSIHTHTLVSWFSSPKGGSRHQRRKPSGFKAPKS